MKPKIIQWVLLLWLGAGSFFSTYAGDVDWKNNLTFYGDNTEFFEPFRVRETLLGQQFKSYLEASVGEHTALQAGLFADHRSAQEITTTVQPILSFVYQNPDSEGLLGTLQPVHRHGLVEPLELTTLELTRPIEYGAEWIQKSGLVNADVFLDWQQLLVNANVREIFDYGGSARLPLIEGWTLDGQCHGYHVGGANTGGIVRNNLVTGLGMGLKGKVPLFGEGSLEALGLESADDQRPNYPGPVYGYGLYVKGSLSPEEGWELFGIAWIGKDYMSDEGDSNYNSLGADGVFYKSNRNYEELGLRRFVTIESGVTFDFELRCHWIEDSWANSLRFVAQAPFDVVVDVQRRKP